jgi:hypothetical protein
MRTLQEALDRRVLLADGALARQLRQHELDPARDFYGAEGLLEVLNLSRGDLVRDTHLAYLRAGADVIRTNTLAASPLSLAQHGLADSAFYINYAAAQLACEAVDSVPGRGRRRFVLGMVRDQGWDRAPGELEEAVAVQVEGLLAGGVDGVALDITPGAGRAPVFLRGAGKAKAKLHAAAPIFLFHTPMGPSFSARARELADAVIRHRPGRAERGDWLARAVGQEAVNLIGGGASPAETEALDRLLRLEADDNLRPYTAWGRPAVIDEVVPPSSSLHIDPAVAEVH